MVDNRKIAKFFVNRPEALPDYQHASRALQSHCRKLVFFRGPTSSLLTSLAWPRATSKIIARYRMKQTIKVLTSSDACLPFSGNLAIYSLYEISYIGRENCV